MIADYLHNDAIAANDQTLTKLNGDPNAVAVFGEISEITKEKIVVENNKPENKKRIIKERDGYNDATNPLSENECFTPKTLQELKTLCPKELTGLERSQWIANKRQEYGL
jgi:hypothetical protein